MEEPSPDAAATAKPQEPGPQHSAPGALAAAASKERPAVHVQIHHRGVPRAAPKVEAKLGAGLVSRALGD
eukprot:Skav203793  [mRNA]  locus=scaffold206:582631:590098:+ [translate_table: standard]